MFCLVFFFYGKKKNTLVFYLARKTINSILQKPTKTKTTNELSLEKICLECQNKLVVQ